MRLRRARFACAVLATAVTTGCASAGAPAVLRPAVPGPSAGAARASTGSHTAQAPPPVATATPEASVSHDFGAHDAVAHADVGPRAAAPGSYDPSRDAAADIASALARSATDSRPVLLDFGADWCPDCRTIEKLYHSPDIEAILRAKYRVVSVDVGRFDHNLDVAARYVDLRRSGIPALVVLGPDGAVRTASNDGRFSSARTLNAAQLANYLSHWAL
ncbi:thioredoxin family protein [Kitasatospora sp. NPDC004240]